MKLKELNNLDEGLIATAFTAGLIAKYGLPTALAIKAVFVASGLTLIAAIKATANYLSGLQVKEQDKLIQQWKEQQKIDKEQKNLTLDKKQVELIKQWKKEQELDKKQDLDKKQVVTEGDVVKFPAPDALKDLTKCPKCHRELINKMDGDKFCIPCLTTYSNEPKIKNTPNTNKGLTRIK